MTPRISLAGSGAMLLDAAGERFDEAVQERVWSVCAALSALPWVKEAVPGMNNMLVVVDPLASDAPDGPDGFAAAIRAAWSDSPDTAVKGRTVDVPVHYGGAAGEDLPLVAAHAGMTEAEVVRLHAAGNYRVGAVGAMPGFPYLFGLDPRLACPRRTSPRLSIPIGAVIIGGPQTAIMPCTAPSGWHIIGHTVFRPFDPAADPACRLRPGDRIRFIDAGPAP